MEYKPESWLHHEVEAGTFIAKGKSALMAYQNTSNFPLRLKATRGTKDNYEQRRYLNGWSGQTDFATANTPPVNRRAPGRKKNDEGCGH
jgi:hypothetical protein